MSTTELTNDAFECHHGEGDRARDLNGSLNHELEALIATIPEGWSSIQVAGQSWGVTRTTRAASKVISIDGERLGSAERLGANIWLTSGSPILRPCEVPEETVMQFLRAAAAAFSGRPADPQIGSAGGEESESGRADG